MGYRFTLESANIVANLTFGKVLSCYREIYSSNECFEEFIQFLDMFQQNLYSNEMERYMKSVLEIRETLWRYKAHKKDDRGEIIFYRETLDALKKLSKIFDRCTIKSLLLPPMKENSNYDYDFMTSPRFLRRLYERHQGDSCLILQPQECPKCATVFDAFPNFEVALLQADKWPAVFFWESPENYVFAPVETEREVLILYEIIKYERHPLGEIRRFVERKKKTSHYLFQLSDLHLGARNVYVAERRLKMLVQAQLSKIEVGDSVDFLISGDAVDSPTPITEANYSNFSEFIEAQCGQKPIRVLGNHDINHHGISMFRGKKRVANIVGEYPKIKILDDIKVILLLFNSNTDGKLAEGKIGTTQMAEMGNLLDKVKNLETYSLIAVLHHHLVPIPRPNYYDRKWYERILPNDFMEASLKLIDADLFLKWLHLRNVRVVLHGHKHIPFFTEVDGIKVISCGSSTGQVVHKEKDKTFISYNILKISSESITCTQFAEEIYGAGEKNIRTETIEL